jgi:hypothetical protein
MKNLTLNPEAIEALLVALSNLEPKDERGYKMVITPGEVLQYWMKSCMASTSTTVTPEVFGDQKYLDNFSDYGNVKVFEGHGVNVAPWNCNQIEIYENSKTVNR